MLFTKKSSLMWRSLCLSRVSSQNLPKGFQCNFVLRIFQSCSFVINSVYMKLVFVFPQKRRIIQRNKWIQVMKQKERNWWNSAECLFVRSELICQLNRMLFIGCHDIEGYVLNFSQGLDVTLMVGWFVLCCVCWFSCFCYGVDGCFVWVWNLVSDMKERTRRAYENRVVRRMFGTNREEVTGDWRRIHNEELHYLYASPNTVLLGWSDRGRSVWWGMGEMRNAYKILVGKPEGKTSLRRPRHR